MQLELNARYVAQAGLESAVESRALLDVCDVSRFHDGEFDAVLAYGGPLSYAFERASIAVTGLLRVTRVGGPVVASVMSTLGAYRHFLPAVLELSLLHGDDVNDRILATGDLRETQPPGSGQHTRRMSRSQDVETLVAETGAALLGLSAVRNSADAWCPRRPGPDRCPTSDRCARSTGQRGRDPRGWCAPSTA